MEQSKYNKSSQKFAENQIICLEYENICLYGEVIQLIPLRQMCWLRPICLVFFDVPGDLRSENFKLISLNSAADLLWPTCLFRPALDTEAILFLAQLENTDKSQSTQLSSTQYLNQFLQRVWMANRNKF